MRHKQDLVALFDGYASTGDVEVLIGYLLTHSNLPGRRANLELAGAFGDLVAERTAGGTTGLWHLCVELAAISAVKAPVNSPEEFLPFCGALGFGAIGSVSPRTADEALAVLRKLANDPRWRTREAVRSGLQRMLTARASDTLRALYTWVDTGDCLQMRAAAAAVAEPALLRDEGMARSALELHRQVFGHVMVEAERRSEPFRTLRKALGYTLSVVVQALPEE